MPKMTAASGRAGPSLMRYAPAFVLLAIAIADAARVADTDLWGHIAFGRLFLQVGPVSRDRYNYSAPGDSWVIHEWLAELMMARTYDLFGILGLKLWKLACSTFTIILLAMAEAETGAGLPIQAGVLIMAAVALMPMMQFRPQLYTYIFLAALMALLARENYRRRSPLWLAVPMLGLWANLHGGFIIGVVALAVYTGVTAIGEMAGGRGYGRVVRLAAVTVAGALATLINPYGSDAWFNVLGAAGNPVTRKIMVDWQPLLGVLANSQGMHLATVFFVLVVAILVTLALAVVVAPRGGDLPLVAIAAVMGAAAFDVVRNMPLAVIAAVAPLARHLHLLAKRLHRDGAPESASSVPARFNRIGQSVVIAGALVLTFGTRSLLSSRIPAAMDYPVGAVAFMRAHQLYGNLLARFEWGQYLIFHLPPSCRIFIDGRVDLVYPPKVIDEYLDFFAGQPGGSRILDQYPHDYVLMPSRTPAETTMRARKDWRLIYRDGVAALFARADSSAAHLPGVPVNAAAPPSYFP